MVPSYVNEVKGHIQGQGSSEVKLGGKCWLSLFASPSKSLSPIGPKLGSKMQWGFLCVLMRSKVMYQSQRSSEVNLIGKCKSWFDFLEKLKSNYNQT